MGLSIKQIEIALKAKAGFISYAAEALGVTHSAISQRVKRSAHLQKVVYDIQESCLDLAETKLLGKIKSGDLGAICFYLKCKGKKRGYIEKQQFEDVTPKTKTKAEDRNNLVKAVDEILGV